MAGKENKKEMKWFPDKDLHISIGIAFVLSIILIIKACNV